MRCRERAEKLMTRTGDGASGAPVGASRPNRLRSIRRRSSTWPAQRVGCLVSMASSTRRPASATSSSSRSRVRTEVSSQSGPSVLVRLASLFFQEPKSRAARSASSRADTAPRPFDVRLTRRSCTQTRWPSAVSRTSHSRASAPSSMALLYAASVCSGPRRRLRGGRRPGSAAVVRESPRHGAIARRWAAQRMRRFHPA